jgi:glycosyltransferase involved in cell wall biosynthesis
MRRTAVRILDVGDDYFHPTAVGGWTWDWPFPVREALALFEQLLPVGELRFWGRISRFSATTAGETKFAFPAGGRVSIDGVELSGERGGHMQFRAIPGILTKGVRAVTAADIVLFRWPSVASMLLLPFALLLRKTTVMRLRVDADAGLAASGYVRSRALLLTIRFYTRLAMRLVDVPVCISAYLRDKFGNDRTLVLNECSVMSHDIAPRSGDGTAGMVLYVGRLMAEKGVATLLRAMPLVPAARLVIVGGGAERPRLEVLARELGIETRVEFRGGVSDRSVLAAIFREAALFVLPSHSEGLGCVLLEAMAAGVPIVATDVGGIPELIENGVNGLLVPAADVHALADAITRALADSDLRRSLAKRGDAIVRRQTFEQQTGRWIELAAEAFLRKRSA